MIGNLLGANPDSWATKEETYQYVRQHGAESTEEEAGSTPFTTASPQH